MEKEGRLSVLGAGVLSAGIAFSASAQPVEAYSNESGHQARTEQTEREPAQVLRDFVERKGSERLTFEEARDIVPHISALYNGSFKNTTLTSEEMNDKTFVMPGGFTDEDIRYMRSDEDVKQSPLLQRLSSAYPDIEYGSDISATTINAIYDNLGQNIKTNKGIEVFAGWFGFDDFNMPDSTMGATIDGDDITLVPLEATNENMHLQIDSVEDSQCTFATPAVAFITTQAHEYGHLDTHAKTDGYEKTVKPALLSQASKYLQSENGEYTDGRKNGFRLNMQSNTKNGELVQSDHFIGLDELVVHYIAVKLLDENEIPSMILPGSRDSKGLRNFDAIMERSGLSLNELARLHRDGRLERFLIKIAEGARDKSFGSDNQKMKYAFRKFVPLFKDQGDWYRTFEEDFDIDGSEKSSIADNSSDSFYFNGCYVNFDSK